MEDNPSILKPIHLIAEVAKVVADDNARMELTGNNNMIIIYRDQHDQLKRLTIENVSPALEIYLLNEAVEETQLE